MGALWFIDWINALQKFSEQNFIANSHNMTSISGTTKAFAYYLNDNASGTLHYTLSFLATTLAVSLAVFFLIRISKVKRVNLNFYFLKFAPVLVLISPQTLFYDIGIAFSAYLSAINFSDSKSYNRLFVLILVSWILVMTREYVSCPLLFLLPLYMAMTFPRKP